MWNTCTRVRACAGEAEEENPINVRQTCDMINDSGQFSPSAPRQTLLQIRSRYAHRLRVAFSPSHTPSCTPIFVGTFIARTLQLTLTPFLTHTPCLSLLPVHRCGIRTMQRRGDLDVPPFCGRHPGATLTRPAGERRHRSAPTWVITNHIMQRQSILQQRFWVLANAVACTPLSEVVGELKRNQVLI